MSSCLVSVRDPRGADAVSSGGGLQHRLSSVAGETSMQGPNLERWQELCRQAATEQDPKRLMEFTAEIIRLLDEKEKRLLAKRKQDPSTSETTEGAA